jgi:hypothetical protein
MQEGIGSNVGDEGHVMRVSAQDIVKVVEGRLDVSGVGSHAVGYEEKNAVVARLSVGSPNILGVGHAYPVAVGGPVGAGGDGVGGGGHVG